MLKKTTNAATARTSRPSTAHDIYKIILTDLYDEWRELGEVLREAIDVAIQFFAANPIEKEGLYKKTRAAFRNVDFHLMTIRSSAKTIKEARWD